MRSRSDRPSAAGVPPNRLRCWSSLALAALLCLAAVTQILRVPAGAREEDQPRGLLGELAGELAGIRSVGVRLSVAAGYRPCAARDEAEPGMPDAGCAAETEWTPSRRLARRALEAGRAGTDPDALHTLALIDLLSRPAARISLDRSIQTLWTVARASDRPATGWADLSAAYLIRAEQITAPRDLLSAAEAAERALENEPGNRSALYNRALALQRFGLVDAAAAAWRQYLAADSASPWAAEARRRLASLMAVRAAPPPAPDAPPSAYADYARTDPQGARLLGQDSLLGAWGAAVLAGDAPAAEWHLRRAETLGNALRERPGGDQTLWDAVQAIHAAEGGAALRPLAAAHRDYAVGRAQYDSARYATAEPMMRAAAAGAPALRGWAELFLANTRFYAGDLQGAEADLLALSSRTDTLRHTALAARLRWALTGTRVRGDRYEAALEPGEAAGRLFARAGEREYTSSALSTLANAQFALGDADAAYTTWRSALVALRPYRASARLHALLVAIAAAAANDGLYRAAVRVQDESVAVTHRRGEPVYAAEALLARARLLPATGEMARAEADIDSARRVLRWVAPETQGWMGADLQQAEGISALFAEPARPAQAAAALDSAAAFFAGRRAPFRGFAAVVSAAEANLAMGDLPGAMRRLETALAMLELRRDSIRVEPRRAAVFDRARSVVDRVVMLHLAAGRASEALHILDRARGSLALAAADPGGGRRRPIAGPPGEVGVEYGLIADTLLVWTVSGREVHVARTVIDTVRFTRTVTRLQLLLESGGDDRAAALLLEALHAWLVRPVEAHLGPADQPVVLVVDGTLARVPFAALRDARRGRHLVQEHPLRFAVSLREAWTPRRAGRADGVALVVDPEFAPEEHPGLDRLPAAAAEAEAIIGEYDAPRVLPGIRATRDEVRRALEWAGVVHYAGHAVFDDERPERSYLVLAPLPDRPGTGRLTAASLGEMRLLQAPLVVLAACRTVNAGHGRAEGFSGLTGGLLAAGASGVVGGLWEIDDELTRPLVVAFHRHYRGAGDPARALRAAQLELLASTDAALRSPRAWAGFRYTGR